MLLFHFFLIFCNVMSLDNLPYETLSRIFYGLTQNDLIQCQKVCRSWRMPARDTFLKIVHLRENRNIDELLSVIEDIPSYLGNIKQLVLGYNAHISVHQAERLLCGITGVVEEIQIYVIDSAISLSQASMLSKTMCSKITAYCTSCQYGLYDSLIKPLHQSLTSASWYHGVTLEFLSNFHQLQDINLRNARNLNNFERWLPLFEQLDRLKSIRGSLTINDSEDFLNNYMLTKSDQERNRILKKLSKLETLKVHVQKLCTSSIRFITRYLIGLKDMEYVCYSTATWTHSQLDAFSNDLLNFTSNLTNYHVDASMDRATLLYCFSSFFPKVLHQVPRIAQCISRVLSLRIIDSSYSTNNITISHETSSPQFRLSLNIRLPSNEFKAIFENVKEFQTQFGELSLHASSFKENSLTYLTILHELPNVLRSLTYVSLGVPLGRLKKLDIPEQEYQFRQVKYLELTSIRVDGSRSHFCFEQLQRKYIWDDYISTFPEIKYLRLSYFTGVWKPKSNEFHILLNNIKLETLYLDVTPVFTKSKFTARTHFILDVKSHNRRCFYKISLNYLQITNITEAMAEVLWGEGCTRIRIHALDLEFINLYLYPKDLSRSRYGYIHNYLDHHCMNMIMEAKISLA